MPPHHQVGVRAQPGHVVDAAHDHVGLRQLGEELLDLGGLGVAVGAVSRAEHVVEPEHRPHGVADGVVDLADPRCLRRPARCSWPHCCAPGHAASRGGPPRWARTPVGGPVRRADHGGHAHPVVRRPAHREPGDGRRRRPGSARPGRGGPRRTAAAPRPSAARGRRPASPRARSASARSASDQATSSSSLACSATASPWRPSEVRRCTTSPPSGPPRTPRPAARTQSHLAKENVDALIRRPSTPGTRKPEPVPSSAATPARSAARKASVTTATEADSTAGQLGGGDRRRRRRAAGRWARPASPAPRRPPRGARARWSDPASARSRRRCAAARARSSDVRTAKEPSASASASPAIPPASPANTGFSATGGPTGSAAAASSSEPRATSGEQLRHGGPGRERARPAGVHPAEQRLDEPVDDLVAEPGGHQVADGDVAVDLGGRERRLGPDPGQPLVGQHAGGRELVQVERHAHQRARQRAQRAAGPHPRRRGRGVHDRRARARRPGRRPRAAGAASPRRRRRRGRRPPPPGAACRRASPSPRAGRRRARRRRGRARRSAPRRHRRRRRCDQGRGAVVPRPQARRGGTRARPRVHTVGPGGWGAPSGAGGEAEAAAVEDQRQRGAAVLDGVQRGGSRSCGRPPRPRGRPSSRTGPVPRRGSPRRPRSRSRPRRRSGARPGRPADGRPRRGGRPGP